MTADIENLMLEHLRAIRATQQALSQPRPKNLT